MMDSFYKAADDKRLTTLISLYISAAFDTASVTVFYCDVSRIRHVCWNIGAVIYMCN